MSEGSKVCGKCKKTKEKTEFYKASGRADGLQGWCKDCQKDDVRNRMKTDPEYRARQMAIKSSATPEQRRIWWLKKYDLTPEDYDRMYEEQNGVCWICGRPETARNRGLGVDHCHGTGKVRGLLCGACNRALGLFQDDVERLKKAIEYLSA